MKWRSGVVFQSRHDDDDDGADDIVRVTGTNPSQGL
jgi:hypothetical protein